MERAKKSFMAHLLVVFATVGWPLVAFGSNSGDENSFSLSGGEKPQAAKKNQIKGTDNESSDIFDFLIPKGQKAPKKQKLSLKDLNSSENSDGISQGSDLFLDKIEISQDDEIQSLSKVIRDLSLDSNIEIEEEEEESEFPPKKRGEEETEIEFTNPEEEEEEEEGVEFSDRNEEEEESTEAKINIQDSPFPIEGQQNKVLKLNQYQQDFSSSEDSLIKNGQEEESFQEKEKRNASSPAQPAKPTLKKEESSLSSDDEEASEKAKIKDSSTSSDGEEDVAELRVGQHVLTKKDQKQIRKNEKKLRKTKLKTIKW